MSRGVIRLRPGQIRPRCTKARRATETNVLSPLTCHNDFSFIALRNPLLHIQYTTATSKKTRRTCTSTDQSEQDFASSACKDAEYTRNWTQFFGLLKDGPTRLGVDNFATYKPAGAPIRKWSPSSKQHDVNEKYVIECVERGTIDVQHRSGQLPEEPQPTEGFRADAMAKSLPRQPHEFYYDEIQGRPLPAIGARIFVTGQSAGTITSGLHSRR